MASKNRKVILVLFAIAAYSAYVLIYGGMEFDGSMYKATKFVKQTRITDVRDAKSKSSVAILELLPWERESMFANSTLTGTCSLGTIASYGTLVPQDTCGGGPDTYDFVRQKLDNELFGDNYDDDDYVCDVCRILDLLGSRKLRTISFWGDSVHNQVFDGFVCEIGRRNISIISDETISTGCGSMVCVQSVRTVVVLRDEGDQTGNNHQPKNQNQHEVVLKFFFSYKPGCKIDPIVTNGTDILVFNFGLHYYPWHLDKYRNHMSCVLSILQPLISEGKISLVAFRETSAQHFNNTRIGGGEYQGRASDECVPNTIQTTGDDENDDDDDAPPLFGWRDREFTNVALQNGFRVHLAHPRSSPDEIKQKALANAETATNNTSNTSNIFVLPFANFSVNFHELHKANDCTHYCSTPHLWYPIWRSLRLSMQVNY